ncbi:unnamed protein product, partial [Parnassius mnemosyne]
MPSGSHGILGDAFVKLLSNAGHEVTYITATSKITSYPNVTIVDVSSNINLFPENFLNIKAIMEKDSDMNENDFFFPIMDKVSLVTIKNKKVQKILTDDSQQFDVVVAEWMYNELYAGFSTVFNCPLIWFSTLEPHWLILRIMDEALSPAYNPDSMSTNMIPYTFFQRLQELWLQMSRSFYRELWKYNEVTKVFNEMYAPVLSRKGRAVPSYEDVRYNGSLMLGNSYVALGQATRLPQSYKPVAGFHIDKNVQPLPKNLKVIMDHAKHGVIYFSMGSNLQSSQWPNEIKAGLLRMFGELKQTVLWKFEESLAKVPSNVHLLKWAPQQSILAHPKCVLFITHSGLLSTTEAVHFGVPIIGIPVFADQFVNILRAVNKGFAKKVDLSYEIVDELKTAIEDILIDPRYHDKAKELSFVYHDRPVTPQKEIVHWVEHVIRTNGAGHLRSPALFVPWYQKMYLDLISIIVFIIIMSVIFVKYSLQTCKHVYYK